MAGPSDELIQDYDYLAASLGVTPVFDLDTGEIVPIGLPEGGQKQVYVVWVGRAIGLFANWGLTSAMVSGFPHCAYKGYPNLERARLGWFQGPTGVGRWTPPRPRAAVCTPGVVPACASQLPREVRVQAPSQQPRPLPTENYDAVPEESPAWEDDPAWEDEPVREYDSDDTQVYSDAPEEPLSPTISSLSTLSLSMSPALTAGTLSPGTVATPSLAPSSTSAYSPRVISRTLSCPGPAHSEPPPIRIPRRAGPATKNVNPAKAASTVGKSRVATSASTTGRPGRRASPISESRQPSRQTPAADTLPRDRPDAYLRQGDFVPVPKPRRVYVVVRGDYPGIYFDRHTASVMLGASPGMKLVVFRSLSKAAWYFVQQYMRRQVGVPVYSGPDLVAPQC